MPLKLLVFIKNRLLKNVNIINSLFKLTQIIEYTQRKGEDNKNVSLQKNKTKQLNTKKDNNGKNE